MASDEVAFSKVSELAALLKVPGIQDGRIAAVLEGIAKGRPFDDFSRQDLVHTLLLTVYCLLFTIF